MDEYHMSPKHKNDHSQCMHGGVSITGNKFSIYMLCQVINGEVLYSNTTHRMIVHYDHIRSIVYQSLYDNFDKEQFNFNLFH